MKYLTIAFILMAGVAWAGEIVGFKGPEGYTTLTMCKQEGSIYKWNTEKKAYECVYECVGVKVYEEKEPSTMALAIHICGECLNYICEGNGYTGQDCFNYCDKPFSDKPITRPESRYDQLIRIFKK